MKYIRQQIEAELGSLVDQRIDPLVGSQQYSDIAGVIDEILASEE